MASARGAAIGWRSSGQVRSVPANDARVASDWFRLTPWSDRLTARSMARAMSPAVPANTTVSQTACDPGTCRPVSTPTVATRTTQATTIIPMVPIQAATRKAAQGSSSRAPPWRPRAAPSSPASTMARHTIRRLWSGRSSSKRPARASPVAWTMKPVTPRNRTPAATRAPTDRRCGE